MVSQLAFFFLLVATASVSGRKPTLGGASEQKGPTGDLRAARIFHLIKVKHDLTTH